MTFRDVWTAVLASAVGLVALAAVAFGLVTASIATADHATIAKAIGAAPAGDVGLLEMDRRVFGFREGYYPDCAGLSLLLGEGAAAGPVIAAVRSETIYSAPPRSICEDLQRSLRGDRSVTWFTYARYWHGALLLHRAVLGGGDDYQSLKTAAALVMALSALMLAAALASRLGWLPAVAVFAAVVSLSDMAAVTALPLQAVCYAALLACAAAFVRWGAVLAGGGALVAAAMAGGVYNFFDFFCNPESLALICAWSWAAVGLARGQRRELLGVVLIFAAALAGYGGFWALKWLIAAGYQLAGDDLYIFSVGDFGRWAAGGQEAWWFGAPTLTILTQTFDRWWKVALGLALLAATLAAIRGQVAHRALPSLMLPVLLAFAVLEAIAGHTLAHAAITFRAVPIGFGLLLASLLLARQTTAAARKPAIAAAS